MSFLSYMGNKLLALGIVIVSFAISFAGAYAGIGLVATLTPIIGIIAALYFWKKE